MLERIALEAHGVSKRYGERDALCDVDLITQPGRAHEAARLSHSAVTLHLPDRGRDAHRAPGGADGDCDGW